MTGFLLLVLMIGASARATRLVIKDDWPPLLWARNKIIQFRKPVLVRELTTDDTEFEVVPVYRRNFWYVGELVTCPWCASAYVSGAVVLIVWAMHGLPLPVLWWGAVWYATGWLLSHE